MRYSDRKTHVNRLVKVFLCRCGCIVITSLFKRRLSYNDSDLDDVYTNESLIYSVMRLLKSIGYLTFKVSALKAIVDGNRLLKEENECFRS